MNHARRSARHHRLRHRLQGTPTRPRVSVFRSNQSISVQLIDDQSRHTLLSVGGRQAGETKTAQATRVGTSVAKQARAAGISRVVFDRGGYRYHGRVKAVAEQLRAGGLEL